MTLQFLQGLTTFLFLVSNLVLSAQQNEYFKSVKTHEDHLKVQVENGMYHFSILSDKIIETSFIPYGEQLDTISHAVVLNAIDDNTQFVESENTLSYGLKDGIKVSIKKQPFQISYEYMGRSLIAEGKGYIKTDSTEILDFEIGKEEVLFGGGARAIGMNRRGHRLELYNRAHYGYETKSALMNFTIPLVISSKGYAIHFDNPAIGFLDLDSKKDNTLQYEAIGGRKTYQVIAGNNLRDVTVVYTKLTGRQPMPPRWSFGNFASRFGYHSEEEVRNVVAKFKEDSIPLDALVLDIYWFGKDIKGHMGNLEFLSDSFPTPKKMIKDLKEDGVKTILITEPFVLSTSKRWKEADTNGYLGKNKAGATYAYDFYFGNTGIIDIYNSKAKEWFWSFYKRFTDEYNVAGWWGDLGEPEVHPSDLLHATGSADEVHNIYGHDWARLVYEGYQKDFPKKRPFILMRAGYSGSQKYGMIPWSGDVSRSWGGLQSQTEIALQMGMQGMGYMHSDLGGFAGGEEFDAELYTRWLQYGVFQPIFRPHAQEHIAPEPVFHDKKTLQLAKQSIELRYKLLPYNYTLAFINNQKGLPLMRPVSFDTATDSSDLLIHTNYLWGENLLVAPVTSSGLKTMDIKFPESGVWFDFYTDKRYESGIKTVELFEDHIPTFAKAGAFIPMIDVVMTTDAYTTQKLNLHYYHDDSVEKASEILYEDDGITPQAFEKNQYELIKFNAINNKKELSFNYSSTIGKQYSGKQRDITLVIHNVQNKPKETLVDNSAHAFEYNQEQRQLIIISRWDSQQKQEITLKF
ncbi:glycoside hydrolase family 31 protein [Aquimarina intermedia]|uniref:Alpha-glucosidase/oligosaccharide 4-alpha-D-glucosyltransferase n=1 Tax=Aquimarina intermedia TaxID=350814 RepID=A0A5S5C6N2_9FLAO|nr:TIM-barrel domain-containing protein [Aquimarina intermedia]TYP74957.1 alpha-glucosidase/oligosaccharide 4-alpha-D-glucosyltransferase [Aquimarina intermedia]